MTGKNVRYVATAMTDSQSALSATTTSGAMARIGTVWDATTYGTKARSASREWTNRIPSPSPRTLPSANPASASPKRERGLTGQDDPEWGTPALSGIDERPSDVPDMRQ